LRLGGEQRCSLNVIVSLSQETEKLVVA